MKSKQFFSVASLLVLTLFAFNSHAQEIGAQLYSFRNEIPKDIPGTLAKIRAMGIRELEAGGTYGLSLDSFKTLLKINDMKVVSVGADFEELATNPQKAVERAKSFGAKYVVCFWLPHEGKDFTLANAENAVKVFNQAGKVLSENGLSLCYHPHGYEFRPYGNETLFDYLVKGMNPEYANFEMDVFWIKHPGQDPVALLKKYPNRFPLMHLKDRKPGTPGNHFGEADVESNVVLGTGDVNIAAVMKVAPGAGVKHYFIEDESSRSMQQVPQSIAFLKSLK